MTFFPWPGSPRGGIGTRPHRLARRLVPRRLYPSTVFRSVTLSERWPDEGGRRTLGLLDEDLGFCLVGEAGRRFRFAAGKGGAGALADVLWPGRRPRGGDGRRERSSTSPGARPMMPTGGPGRSASRTWASTLPTCVTAGTSVHRLPRAGRCALRARYRPAGLHRGRAAADRGTHLMSQPAGARQTQLECGPASLSIPEVRTS